MSSLTDRRLLGRVLFHARKSIRVPRLQRFLMIVALASVGAASASSYVSAVGQLTVQTIWQHTPISWVQLTCSGTCPTAEEGAALADDPGDGYVLLQDTSGNTWSFHNGAWSEFAAITGVPVAQTGATMVFVASPGGNPGYGGQIEYKSATGVSSTDYAFVYDQSYTGTATWTDLYCTSRTNPNCYLGQVPGANAMYAPLGVTGHVFGGMVIFTSAGDSWITEPGYAPIEWATTGPAPQTGAAMAWDYKDGYGILFDTLGNTWKLAESGTWSQLIAVSSCTATTCPSVRTGATMVYDAACGYVLLFGGKTAAGGQSDTWKFTGGTWTELFPTTSPPARYDASGTYDSEDGYVLIFGGYNSAGSSTLGDWWELSPAVGGCP